MRTVAEHEQPDLLLDEGMCRDPAELAQVEYVTTHTPEILINSMRAGVREVLPSPVSAAARQSAVNRAAAKLVGAQAKKSGKVLAFIPCKGGSGATFLATNLGYQLAEANTVLLMDLNLQFGDALSFVSDGKPVSTLADVAHDIHRLDASFLAASTTRIAGNYSILAAPEDPSQAMEIKPEHIEAILALAVAQYDFVLLDVGRVLDVLSIKALDRAYRIFPVLQASVPVVRNAKKLLTVFYSLGFARDKIVLIVNRFDKRGEIGLEDIRRSLGAYSLHTVPNSYKEASTSINHGNALIEIARSNAVVKSLAGLALALLPKQGDDSRGLFGRLFKRA